MNKDIYTPTHNGIQGLEEYGDGADEGGFHDGYFTGRYTDPAAVEDYVEDNDVELCSYRDFAHSDNTTPVEFWENDPCGWKWEYTTTGLAERGPAKWAEGALQFRTGWNASREARVLPEYTYATYDENGDVEYHQAQHYGAASKSWMSETYDE